MLDLILHQGNYVVAVSGGVDSVVLLDLMAKHKPVVAHFDHGIRDGSEGDRRFVEALALRYGLDFEYDEGKLGPEASEERARDARYKFLRHVKEKHNADAIVTAHHQDDVVETMIINLLRGTNRKGLSSLGSSDDVLRPMLSANKQQIIDYARANDLDWVEDETNKDTKYLRNYVRHNIMTKLNGEQRRSLLNIYEQHKELNPGVDSLRTQIIDEIASEDNQSIAVPRKLFVDSDFDVASELLIEVLKRLEPSLELDAKQLKRLWLQAKTLKHDAPVDVSKRLIMKVNREEKLSIQRK